MTDPIRILQVSKSTGGVGQYLRSLIYGLDKSRFEVLVVCLSDGADVLAEELSRLPGVRAISFPMARYHIDPWTDLKVLWKLIRVVRRERFDIIHAHVSKPGFLARLAAAGTGIPVLYCPAGFAFHDGVSRSHAMLYAAIERLMAALFTEKIITVCNEEKDLARRFGVGRDEQFVNVYNGVEPAQFNVSVDREKVRESLHVPQDAFVVGTVARLSKQKAPHDFVMAAAQVHATQPNVHFVWVGDGELDAEIRALIQSYNLETVFHLAGLRRDIPAILNVIDCFVLSSHWEGFSISVLEAMASALPVVMTRVSGAAEAVVDGKTGFLVPIGDTQALATALSQLVENPARAKEMGEAARSRLEEKFSVQRMVCEVETIYKNLMENASIS